MRRLALALLIATAGCGRSGAPSSGIEDPFPHPRRPALGDPGDIHVWHSWDVAIADDGAASVVDTNGEIAASVSFYVGGNSFTVQPGTVLDERVDVHPNEPQDAGPVVFENGDGDAFPYVGKNLSPRTASDPAPLGVFDLQFHPRDDDRYVIAAFKVPMPGRYVLSGFAARRVLGGGANVTAAAYLGSAPDNPEAIVGAANDMLWSFDDPPVTDLGILSAAERICIAVHRGSDSAVDDATEVAFTITRTDD